jgi:hypothetical protein
LDGSLAEWLAFAPRWLKRTTGSRGPPVSSSEERLTFLTFPTFSSFSSFATFPISDGEEVQAGWNNHSSLSRLAFAVLFVVVAGLVTVPKNVMRAVSTAC